MKKIILTGYGPFGNYSHNPTQKSTQYFNGKIIGDREVVGMVLPCTYYGAFAKLLSVIKDESPYAIISTGLSSRVHGMHIESTFHNVMNGKYPDANNFAPQGLPIMEDSPLHLPATAFVVDVHELFRNNDIPTELSFDADSFICNALGYQTSAYIINNKLKTKNIFIHVPWTSDYQKEVSLEEGKMFLDKDVFYKGLELLIKEI